MWCFLNVGVYFRRFGKLECFYKKVFRIVKSLESMLYGSK